jgi:hypothetical protein
MKRHLLIPDTQVRGGVDTKHIDWAAQAIVEYRPDVVVMIGDHWDMHSLSTHDAPGSEHMENARYWDDVNAGNAAFARLCRPMQKVMAREKGRKKWKPRCVFTFGNHEHRITRAVAKEPRLTGAYSLTHLNTQHFERHGFLEIVNIDGLAYSHYFANILSGRPIGGTIPNRLNKIGRSFVCGHEQGMQYGMVQYPGSIRRHGLVAGSFYSHHESYRGAQGRDEWRGIVVMNEVQNGDYCVMPLTLDYLKRAFS